MGILLESLEFKHFGYIAQLETNADFFIIIIICRKSSVLFFLCHFRHRIFACVFFSHRVLDCRAQYMQLLPFFSHLATDEKTNKKQSEQPIFCWSSNITWLVLRKRAMILALSPFTFRSGWLVGRVLRRAAVSPAVEGRRSIPAASYRGRHWLLQSPWWVQTRKRIIHY